MTAGWLLLPAALGGLGCAYAQNAAVPAVPPSAPASASPTVPSVYVLGPGDEIVIRALDVEEIPDKPIRIDGSGFIRLALVGRIQAQNKTTEELEDEITERLRTYVKRPQVSVVVTEMRSNPVSVLGDVKNPGLHQIQGSKTLVECLALAGGLTETAGYSVRVTRQMRYGAIPLANAQTDPSGQFSIAQVNVKELMEARNPKVNIQIFPNDVILVPKADLVYVLGQVNKAGGFTLRERETMSVLQALALAEGLTKLARPSMARVLRPDPTTGERHEIPVNLKDVMAGKAEDLNLRADDVLLVPDNTPKSAALRGVEAAIELGTGVIIWRR